MAFRYGVKAWRFIATLRPLGWLCTLSYRGFGASKCEMSYCGPSPKSSTNIVAYSACCFGQIINKLPKSQNEVLDNDLAPSSFSLTWLQTKSCFHTSILLDW